MSPTNGQSHGSPTHGNGHGRGGDRDHLLDVEPAAVPALRGAFTAALTEIDEQLALARTELRVAAWAHDPISEHATREINALSVDSDRDALDTLSAFREQLSAAVDNLDKVAEQYALLEDDNRATVTHKGNGGRG
ncbi:MAG: transcriptional regulator [Actinomycetota bacterium]|nr:transcriptional regulator [Actinomycetota bacterium]